MRKLTLISFVLGLLMTVGLFQNCGKSSRVGTFTVEKNNLNSSEDDGQNEVEEEVSVLDVTQGTDLTLSIPDDAVDQLGDKPQCVWTFVTSTGVRREVANPKLLLVLKDLRTKDAGTYELSCEGSLKKKTYKFVVGLSIPLETVNSPDKLDIYYEIDGKPKLLMSISKISLQKADEICRINKIVNPIKKLRCLWNESSLDVALDTVPVPPATKKTYVGSKVVSSVKTTYRTMTNVTKVQAIAMCATDATKNFSTGFYCVWGEGSAKEVLFDRK